MDIGSTTGYPAENLSNFTPHAFIIDDVSCASMEGFLQSLKFQDPEKQLEICQLWGGHAKRKGSKKNKRWKTSQTLYWKGVAIDRHSKAYQVLLDRAFLALAQNEAFQQALFDTGDANLTHSFGREDATNTVLTTSEFCERLMHIRKTLQTKKSR